MPERRRRLCIGSRAFSDPAAPALHSARRRAQRASRLLRAGAGTGYRVPAEQEPAHCHSVLPRLFGTRVDHDCRVGRTTRQSWAEVRAVGKWGKKGGAMARRRSRFVAPGPRAGSVLQASGRSGPRPAARGGAGVGSAVAGLAVVFCACCACWSCWRWWCGGVLVWRSLAGGDRGRRAAAERYATAWVRGQWPAMWRALTPGARAAYPEPRFVAAYRSAYQAAGVRTLRVIKVGAESDGGIPVAVRVGTLDFGTLRGTIVLPVSGTGSRAGVDWDPSLRLPGLRRGEAVRRLSGPPPQRAAILAADGTPLGRNALSAPRSPGPQVPSRPAWSASTTAAWAATRPSSCCSASGSSPASPRLAAAR